MKRMRLFLAAAVALLALAGCPQPTEPAPSANASLQTLEIVGQALSPAFDPTIFDYTVNALNGTTSVQVKANEADAAASSVIAKTGDPTEYASPANILLDEGANIITVEVTAESGATKTYTVTVTVGTYEPAAVADLASLGVGGLTLSPAFDAAVTSYTAEAPYATDTVLVTATAADPNAAVAVEGTGVPSNQSLAEGPNVIDVVVTAEDGTTAKTYTVTVTRAIGNRDATLGSLAVTTAEDVRLSPLFEPSKYDYSAAVPSATATVTVSVQPTVATTTAAINGVAGLSRSVTLSGANTTVTVVATAETGVQKTYTLEVVKIYAATVPVSFLVVESINGTVVDGVDIEAFDDAGASAGTATTVAGYATLNLAPSETYSIVSSKAGQAQSRREGVYVDALVANKVTLVNQKLGMIEKPAVAPLSLGLYVSRLGDLSDMTPFDPSLPLDTTGTTYLIADLVAANGLEATAWSGFGAKLDFDRMPTTFNGIEGYLLGTGANLDADTMATHPVNSTFLFDLSDAEYSGGTHTLDLVAYDVANNRYELAIPVQLVANGAGTDLSAATVSNLLVDIRSYPVSRGFFGKDGGVSIQALDPYLGTTDVSYRTQLTFKVLDGAAANVGIRGFEVLRSDDYGISYESIGTQSYGYLSTGASGVHTYFDADSGLEEGTTYFYRVKAFTDAANTLLSGSAGSKVMAPVSASLVGPSNRGTVPFGVDIDGYAFGPQYTFSISDPSLWNAAEADFFYFALTVNEKAGPYAYYGRFRYNFATSVFEALNAYTGTWLNLGPNGNLISYADGTITLLYGGYVVFIYQTNLITGAPAEYTAGTAYEWDIVGDLSAGHPAWFEKTFSWGGVAKSYVDGYSEGADTANGRFEFVATAAE